MIVARASLWLCTVLLASASARASSGGYVGVASTGCGGCHGSQSSATRVSIQGPATVVRGSTQTFVLVVNNSNATQLGLGFDLGSTDGELMTVASEPQTQLLSGELTQTTSIARPRSGPWRVEFAWTAPASSGTQRILAAANAVDINGGSGSTDQWNLGSLTITVLDALPADSGVAMDAGASVDAGVSDDASARDAAMDSGTARDADAVRDAARTDATMSEGEGDAADAASAPEASVASDAASTDAGHGPTAAGCQCRATTARDPRGATAMMALLLCATLRRRR